MDSLPTSLQSILNKTLKPPTHSGIALAVASKSGVMGGGVGDLDADTPYFIASVTKLYIAALIFQLKEQKALHWDDPVVRHVHPLVMNKSHVIKGSDYGKEITIRHLLSHTSGLADYFQQKGNTGKSLEKRLLAGEDQAWSFDEAFNMAKAMTPNFLPGQPKKASYADTNYQVLGHLLELKYEDKLANILKKQIFEPLSLQQTYLYSDPTDTTPLPFRYQKNVLAIPKAMASFQADGGIVSTAKEGLIFLKAYFEGELFPKHILPEIQSWNKIFFPLQSGMGIQRFKAPWYFSPGTKLPELMGHSGLSGSFAYHSPEKDIYLVGTVNQIAKPATPFQLMVKLMSQLSKG